VEGIAGVAYHVIADRDVLVDEVEVDLAPCAAYVDDGDAVILDRMIFPGKAMHIFFRSSLIDVQLQEP